MTLLADLLGSFGPAALSPNGAPSGDGPPPAVMGPRPIPTLPPARPTRPPYAGAVQDEFAWHLQKYLVPGARLEAEAAIETPRGLFSPNYLVTVPTTDAAGRPSSRRVAVECGASRTLRDHHRRLGRDAALLDSGGADAMVRLRGSDLLNHMEDCLYLAAQWEPALFSERGRINLTTLATAEARTLRVRAEQPAVLLTYAIDPDSEAYFSERHLWHRANGLNPFVLVRHLDARFPEPWAPFVRPPNDARRRAEPAAAGRLIVLRKALTHASPLFSKRAGSRGDCGLARASCESRPR